MSHYHLAATKNSKKRIIQMGENPSRVFYVGGLGAHNIKHEKLLGIIDEFDSKEVILALNSTLEGEATAYFLLEKLKKKDVTVTRIAQGVPAGGDLNYVDNNTLRRAISFRTELK